jgi:hypothetical protein
VGRIKSKSFFRNFSDRMRTSVLGRELAFANGGYRPILLKNPELTVGRKIDRIEIASKMLGALRAGGFQEMSKCRLPNGSGG